VRLAFGDAAGQGLGLGDHCWHNCVGMLGDRAESFSRGGCDLLGCFLEHGQSMLVFET